MASRPSQRWRCKNDFLDFLSPIILFLVTYLRVVSPLFLAVTLLPIYLCDWQWISFLRGHTVKAVCESFHLAKDSGFKVVSHMMPDLPNVGLERDIEQFTVSVTLSQASLKCLCMLFQPSLFFLIIYCCFCPMSKTVHSHRIVEIEERQESLTAPTPNKTLNILVCTLPGFCYAWAFGGVAGMRWFIHV